MHDNFHPEDFEKEVDKATRRLKFKWFMIGVIVCAILDFSSILFGGSVQ